MNKKRCAAFTMVGLASSLLLSGCQLLTGYNQIDKVETAEVSSAKIAPIADEVNLSCIGTYHCEITQIDQTLVIAPDTHEPADIAILSSTPSTDDADNNKVEHNSQNKDTSLLNQKSIKVAPLSASGMLGMTNYYARFKPAKREIHVNFYPENNVSYVERFAMIHEFVEPDSYQLRAYREKSTQEEGSLLETASPAPFCVELLQGDIVKRRFCKQMNNDSQGEFVENTIIDKAIKKEAQV